MRVPEPIVKRMAETAKPAPLFEKHWQTSSAFESLLK
jgi:hypothetical protein